MVELVEIICGRDSCFGSRVSGHCRLVAAGGGFCQPGEFFGVRRLFLVPVCTRELGSAGVGPAKLLKSVGDSFWDCRDSRFGSYCGLTSKSDLVSRTCDVRIASWAPDAGEHPRRLGRRPRPDRRCSRYGRRPSARRDGEGRRRPLEVRSFRFRVRTPGRGWLAPIRRQRRQGNPGSPATKFSPAGPADGPWP